MTPRRWLARLTGLNQQLQQLAAGERWADMAIVANEYQHLAQRYPATNNPEDTLSPGEQQALLQAHEALTCLIAQATATTGRAVREEWQQQRVLKAYFSV